MTAQTSRDVDPPAGWFVRTGSRWLATGVAFACGVAVGSAGLDKQRDADAVRARQGTVALAGVVTHVDAQRSWYAIHVFNAGPSPVRLGPDQILHPGEWSATDSTGEPPLCVTDEVSPADLTVPATVATVDGETREVALPLLDAYGALANARRSECDGILHPERAVAIRQSATTVNTDATVTLTLRLNTWARQPIEVVSVEPSAGLDIKVLDELPIAVAPSSHATIAVKVIAADCSTVLDHGELTITTRYRTATATHQAVIRPTLPYQLIVDQCGGRG